MAKRAHTDPRMARQRRESALARGELRISTEERIASGGITSMAIKREDPALRAAIDEFLARRKS